MVGEWYLSPKQANWQVHPPVPFCDGSKFLQFWDLLKRETVKFDLKLQFIDYNARSLQVRPLQADDGQLGLKSLGEDLLFKFQIFIVLSRYFSHSQSCLLSIVMYEIKYPIYRCTLSPDYSHICLAL